MKILLIVSALLFLANCGYQSKENEAVGQVKKVVNQTPLICYDHTQLDLSLGVMRNGTGSVSKEDLYFTVPDKNDEKLLKDAAVSGFPVKITYNVKRLTFCIDDHIVTKVEITK